MKLKYLYFKKDNRGFILVYTLIFCLFVSFLLLSVYTVKYSYHARLKKHQYFLQSFYIADKTLKTLNGLKSGEFTAKIAELNSFNVMDYGITIDFESENSKININYLNLYPHQKILRPFYDEILKQNGFSGYCFESALDWLDSDDIARPFGAESSSYMNFGYKAKNAPLHTVDELVLVMGFYPQDIDFIKNNFTVYGKGKLNPALFAAKVSQMKGKINFPLSLDAKDPVILNFLKQRELEIRDVEFILDFSNSAYKLNILISRGDFKFPLTAFYENDGENFNLKTVFYLNNY